MSTENVGFNVTAKTGGVVAPLKRAQKEVEKLTARVVELREVDVGGALAANFKRASVEAAKATQSMKAAAKAEAALARQQRVASGGGMLAGLAGGLAGKLAPVAVAGTAAAGLGAMVGAAAQEQKAMATLESANGAGAGRIAAQNRRLGSEFGVSANELHRHAARLSQAGFNTEQVMSVIRANVVAARGDVARLEALMDELVEAGTRGYLEESVLGKYDEAGVGLRTELMKRMDMGKEQLESAMSAGKVSVERYFEVIGRVTGEGSKALEMARAAADTAVGAWAGLKETGTQTLAAMGESLVHLAEGPLKLAAQKLQGLLDYVRPEMGEYMTYEKTAAEKEEDRRTALAAEAAERQRKAREALAGTLDAEAEAWRKVAAAANEARQAEARANETLAERRARVLSAVGLGSGASTADIDAALKADAGYEAGRTTSRAVRLNARVQKLIADGAAFGLTEKATRADEGRALSAHGDAMGAWIVERSRLAKLLGVGPGGTLADLSAAGAAGVRDATPGDLTRANALVAARKELETINRLEKEAAEKAVREREQREKSLAALARRRELQEAQLAGDEKAVELMRLQDEALRVMNEYRAAGASQEEALGYASQEMQQRLMAADAKAAQEAAGKAAWKAPESSGWLRTSKQEVGGAAASGARLYDTPAVTAAKETEKNTERTAVFLNKIFSYLQSNAVPAVLN